MGVILSVRALWLGTLLLAFGCEERQPTDPPVEPQLLSDVERLQQALTQERTLGALEEVDDALAEDLPARAARLLEAGAIPASRRHVEDVRALVMQTGRGGALQRRAVEVLDARRAALEAYRDALSRGLLEDLTLASALRDQREAEEDIGALLDQLAEIRPLSTGPASTRRQVRPPGP